MIVLREYDKHEAQNGFVAVFMACNTNYVASRTFKLSEIWSSGAKKNLGANAHTYAKESTKDLVFF